jgi:hypothetical protein
VQQHKQRAGLLSDVRQGVINVLGGLAAATLLGGADCSALAAEVNLTADPVYDGASVLKPEARQALSQRLSQLDQQTGFHVRVFTQYQMDRSKEGPNPRGIWGSLDFNTVVVVVDPSSPNILNVPFIGDNVLAKLRRPFWTELQSRYGNLFFVREQGEAVALQRATAALADCLERPEGCRVVPGLPLEQYYATLTCSIAGGVVAGLVSRIGPQGIVQRRWVWLLLFSPLWGSLFINFGLGPIVSRTSDTLPIAANTAAFLLAALSPAVLQRLWDGPSDDAAKPPTPPPMSQPPTTPTPPAAAAPPAAAEQPPASSTQD